MEFIKSKRTALISAVCTIVFVQAPHLAWEFANTSKLEEPLDIIHGILFAISIDLGILYFASIGRRVQTIFFMVVSAAVTIKYYYDDIVQAWAVGDYIMVGIILLFAISPALLIYFVSEELEEKPEKTLAENNRTLEAKIINLRSRGKTYDEIQENLGIGRTKISQTIKKYYDMKKKKEAAS